MGRDLSQFSDRLGYFRHLPRKLRTLSRMRIPHGLSSCGVFFHNDDARKKLHREITYSERGNIPSAVWLIVQCFLRLRWCWYFAAAETEYALSQYGAVVAAQENISIEDQRKSVLALSRRFCIHPASIYRFRLYRHPSDALNYCFPREVKPLHRLNNGRSDGPDHSALQDKLEFNHRCIAAGLPCVPTIQHLKQSQLVSPSEIRFSDNDAVFLKSKTGFRGLGAFSITKSEHSMTAHMHDEGRRLRSVKEIRAALENLLKDDDVLVQPRLKNHELLAKVSPPNQTVVLRVVTVNGPIQPQIYSAYLRIPIAADSAGYHSSLRYEVLAGVNIRSGKVFKNSDSSLSLNPFSGAYEDQVFVDLGDEPMVPFWQEISRFSLAAQKEFSTLWAVGWDWFVTPNSAFLLEGNINWEAQKPQEISGGLAEWLIKKSPVYG